MPLKSPVRYLGGKSGLAHHILPYFPDHVSYTEAFGGGGSLLFQKKPSRVEIFNDLDHGLINFYRVVRDPKSYQDLIRRCELTPFSRAEYNVMRDEWDQSDDPVERAHKWFVVARLSFGANFGGSYGYTINTSVRGCAASVSSYLSAIEGLPAIHNRLRLVQIENDDGLAVIERFDGPNNLLYADPPYVWDTRKGGGYAHEMDDGAHCKLVDLLLGLQGMALLSGYASPLYDRLVDAGWRRIDFKRTCSVAGRTRASSLQGAGAVTEQQPRIETLWINPLAQAARQGSLGLFAGGYQRPGMQDTVEGTEDDVEGWVPVPEGERADPDWGAGDDGMGPAWAAGPSDGDALPEDAPSEDAPTEDAPSEPRAVESASEVETLASEPPQADVAPDAPLPCDDVPDGIARGDARDQTARTARGAGGVPGKFQQRGPRPRKTASPSLFDEMAG